MTWLRWDDQIGEGQQTGRPPTAAEMADPHANNGFRELVRQLTLGRLPGEEWRDDSACRHKVDLFYPRWDAEADLAKATGGAVSTLKVEFRRNERLEQARSLCQVCPVRLECLGWGLRIGGAEKDVVIGGTTWNQRKKLLAAVRNAICCGGSGQPPWAGTREVPWIGPARCRDCHQPVALGDDGLTPPHWLDGIPRSPADAATRAAREAGQPTRVVTPLERCRLGVLGLDEPTWAVAGTPWATERGLPVNVAVLVGSLADLPRALGSAVRAEAHLRSHALTPADADTVVRSLELRTPRCRIDLHAAA